MKIKYRRFDDVDYTEVEVNDFNFYNKTHITRNGTELAWIASDGEIYNVLNVCEVYIEEI